MTPTRPRFATLSAASAAESGALESLEIGKLLTGASGLPHDVVDTRLGANVHNSPSGPFAGWNFFVVGPAKFTRRSQSEL